MRLLLLVAACAAAAMASPELFAQFKADYGRQYANRAEEATRFSIFLDNLKYMEEHNMKARNGSYSFELGINQFSDMTVDEFAALYTLRDGYKAPRLPRRKLNATAASSVDWREQNAVTPPKDQGKCGSCWSFSTTGAIEGAWAIAKGRLESLSEQQLIDCSTDYGNHGCSGGLPEFAFKYVIDNQGITSESAYPYTTSDKSPCQANSMTMVASISSWYAVDEFDAGQLQNAASAGPVSVGIEADQRQFQMYKSGVFDGDCGDNVDHAVLVVGFTPEYWIVKNSWGSSWGDKGFIYMSRSVGGQAGICGILSAPTYPVV